MRTRKRFPLILAIAILLLHAGCGDAPRESAATVEPPIEALRGVPIFPLSLKVERCIG
jgi:outer membrane biogenesis lipoprotein LolB